MRTRSTTRPSATGRATREDVRVAGLLDGETRAVGVGGDPVLLVRSPCGVDSVHHAADDSDQSEGRGQRDGLPPAALRRRLADQHLLAGVQVGVLVVDHDVGELVLDDLGDLRLGQPAVHQDGALLRHPQAVGAVEIGEADGDSAIGGLPQQRLIDHGTPEGCGHDEGNRSPTKPHRSPGTKSLSGWCRVSVRPAQRRWSSCSSRKTTCRPERAASSRASRACSRTRACCSRLSFAPPYAA